MSERLTAEEFEEIERGAQYDLTGPQAEAVCREVRAAWAERDQLRAVSASQSQQVSDAVRWIARAEEALRRIASGNFPEVGGLEGKHIVCFGFPRVIIEAARWGLGEVERAPWEGDHASE